MKYYYTLLFFVLSLLSLVQTAPEIGPSSLTLPRLTSVQRNALTPTKGNILFNTTSNQMEYYNGTSWVTYVSGTGITNELTFIKVDTNNVKLGLNVLASTYQNRKNIGMAYISD